MVGSAIHRRLANADCELVMKPRDELDLTDQRQVEDFFRDERIDYTIMAAAKVGGILANDTYPADFIRDNLQIATNTIEAAYRSGTKKLVYLGSSCVYPKLAPQPIREESLLKDELEPTNQWYAIAKIAGIKMCQAYRIQYGFNAIALMPTNLYGLNDNFNPQTSHVLPAMIRRFHDAKESGAASVEVWGTGKPRREFLHVDDLASAVVFLLENYDGDDIVNVGVGQDVSIRELAELVRDIVGFEGGIEFDPSKPDGTPRKLLDVSRIRSLGWQPEIELKDGIEATYDWFLNHQSELRV